MIMVIDAELRRLGVVKNAIDATRVEEINGGNVLEFTAVLDDKLDKFITDNSIFELDEDYFDMALLRKHSNEDGTYTVEVEAEHVSYRLNQPQYNLESFLGSGTPTYTLGQILQDTGFDIGDIDFEEAPVFDIRAASSRRKLLMDYVGLLDGEVLFNKFTISILKKRGVQVAKAAVKDHSIRVISKEINKRKFDKSGKPLISYTCQPLNLPNDSYVLGDAVTIIERTLGIREDLRVVRIQSNPYLPTEVVLTFGNYINGFEAPIYAINNDKVGKDEVNSIIDNKIEEAISGSTGSSVILERMI